MNQDDLSAYSPDAERALLGAMLLDGDCLIPCKRIIASDFFDPVHRHLFSIMYDLLAVGHTLNVISLHERVLTHPRAIAYPGLGYLNELMREAPRGLMAPQLVDAILAAAKHRREARLHWRIAFDIDPPPLERSKP